MSLRADRDARPDEAQRHVPVLSRNVTDMPFTRCLAPRHLREFIQRLPGGDQVVDAVRRIYPSAWHRTFAKR